MADNLDDIIEKLNKLGDIDSTSISVFVDRINDIASSLRKLDDTSGTTKLKKEISNLSRVTDEYRKSLKPSMADNKKYASILDNLQKEIADVNNEIKNLSSSGKKSEKSLETLIDKSKSLTNRLGITVKGIKEAEDAWEEYAKTVRKTSKEHGSLSTTTSIASGNLNDLKKKLDSGSASFGGFKAGAAVAAGSVLLAGKAAGKLGGNLRNLIKDLNKYQINLQATSKVSLVSKTGTSGLENLRKTIGTTRMEFAPFLETLEKVGKVGFDTTSLDLAAKNIVNLYGEGGAAQEVLKDYADLLIKMPSLQQDFSFSASVDDSTSALFALAEQGGIDVAIKAGLIGGGIEGGDAADVQSDIQSSIRVEEDIKNAVVDVAKQTSQSLTFLSAIGKASEYTNVLLGAMLTAQAIGGVTESIKGSKNVASMAAQATEMFAGNNTGGKIVKAASGQTTEMLAKNAGKASGAISKLSSGAIHATKMLGGIGAAVAGVYLIYKAISSIDDWRESLSNSLPQMQEYNKVVGAGSKSFRAMQASLNRGTATIDTLGALDSALAETTTGGLETFKNTAVEGSTSMASLIGGTAAVGFALGSFVPVIGNAVGAIGGALVGAAVGAAASLVSLSYIMSDASVAEAQRAKVVQSTMLGVAADFGYIHSEFGEFHNNLKESAKVSEQLIKTKEKEKSSALVLEQTVKALDAAAKSPITSLYKMREDIGKTTLVLAQKLGSSSDIYIKNAKMVGEASSKYLLRRFKDVGKTMSNQLQALESSNPEVFAMAMQKAEKIIVDESSRFVSEMQSVINQLAQAPDIMMARMRGELAISGQELAKTFSAGISLDNLQNIYMGQATEFRNQLKANAESIKGMRDQYIQTAASLAEADTKLKSFAKEIISGVSKKGIQEGSKESGVDLNGIISAIDSGKDISQDIVNTLEKTDKKIAAQRSDQRAEIIARQKLSDTLGTATPEQNRKAERFAESKKEASRLQLAVSKKKEGSSLTGGDFSDVANKSLEEIKEKRDKAFEKMTKQAKGLGESRGSDLFLDRIEDGIFTNFSSAEIESVYKEASGELDAIQKAGKNFIKIFETSVQSINIPEDKQKEMLKLIAKAKKEKMKSSVLASKLRKLGGKDFIQALTKGTKEIMKSLEDSAPAAKALSQTTAAAKMHSHNLANSEKLALETTQKAFQLIFKSFQDGSKAVQNFINAQSSQMVKAALERGKLGAIEKSLGNMGLPYELMSERFKVDMENIRATTQRAQQIRDDADKMTNMITGAIKKDFGGTNSFKLDEKSVREWMKNSTQFADKNKEVKEKTIKNLVNMGKGMGIDSIKIEDLEKTMQLQIDTKLIELEFKDLESAINHAIRDFNVTDVSKTFKTIEDSAKGMMDIAVFDIGVSIADQMAYAETAIRSAADVEEQYYNDRLNEIKTLRSVALKKKEKGTEEGDTFKVSAAMTDLRKLNAEEFAIKQKSATIGIRREKASLENSKRGFQLQMKFSQIAQQTSETQLDLLEQIGAPFSLILEKQVDIVAEAQKQADIQKEIYERMTGAQKQSAEGEEQKLKMVKAQADVVKKTVQAQRSSMEKLLGAAMGQLGEIGGFKRNLLAQQRGTGLVIGPGGIVQGGKGAAKTKSNQAAAIQAGAMVGNNKNSFKPSKDLKEATDKSTDNTNAISNLSNNINNLVGGSQPKARMVNLPKGKPQDFVNTEREKTQRQNRLKEEAKRVKQQPKQKKSSNSESEFELANDVMNLDNSYEFDKKSVKSIFGSAKDATDLDASYSFDKKEKSIDISKLKWPKLSKKDKLQRSEDKRKTDIDSEIKILRRDNRVENQQLKELQKKKKDINESVKNNEKNFRASAKEYKIKNKKMTENGISQEEKQKRVKEFKEIEKVHYNNEKFLANSKDYQKNKMKGINKGIKELKNSIEKRLKKIGEIRVEDDIAKIDFDLEMKDINNNKDKNQHKKSIQKEKESKENVQKYISNFEEERLLQQQRIEKDKKIKVNTMSGGMNKNKSYVVDKMAKVEKQKKKIQRLGKAVKKSEAEVNPKKSLGAVPGAVPEAVPEAVPGVKPENTNKSTITKLRNGGIQAGATSAAITLKPKEKEVARKVVDMEKEKANFSNAQNEPYKKEETKEEKAKRKKQEEEEELRKQQAEKANKLLSQLDDNIKPLGVFLSNIQKASEKTASNTNSLT